MSIVTKTPMYVTHRLLELSGVYALNQLLGKPTTDRFRQLISEQIGDTRNRRILDIGCGIGNYRQCFRGDYVGVDINPDYIKTARARFGGRFEVMDAGVLSFPGEQFDEAVTIATTHHLMDNQFLNMIEGSLGIIRPGGALHIIDAILPVSPNFAFKSFWFGLDRGRYPRRIEQMINLAGTKGYVSDYRVLNGPLHDTAYIRVTVR